MEMWDELQWKKKEFFRIIEEMKKVEFDDHLEEHEGE